VNGVLDPEQFSIQLLVWEIDLRDSRMDPRS
jgi:hypothetical protein